jgi:predicted O-methyltransferase YrrM
VCNDARVHPLLEQTLATGMTELPDGSAAPLTSSITAEDCALVERMIALCGATSAVEIGMAYGISTLCIADALSRNGPARLVSIDSHQTSGWHGAGLHLLHRAGFSSIVELIEETSQLALPRLVARGDRFDLAFIDGWHTFDHTLVDFFFCDAMLKPGGIAILDDVGFPAIDRVVRFILANRDYELVGLSRSDESPTLTLRVKRAIKRGLRRLARTDRDPSPRHEKGFRALDRALLVALRKRADDARRFNHFERF